MRLRCSWMNKVRRHRFCIYGRPSNRANGTPGEITDGSPPDGAYEGEHGCHWKIQVPNVESVITIEFEYFNLKSSDWMGHDVVLINLGPGADPGPGWERYERHLTSYGSDGISWYDYEYSWYTEEDCNWSFDPYYCDVLDGTLVTDAAWADSWYFRVDAMTEGETIRVTSSTNVAFVIFRSFIDPWEAMYSDPSLTNSKPFGFHAEYEQASAFCAGRENIQPQMSLETRVYQTPEFTIRDNAKGGYAPDSACSWLLAPKFDQDGEAVTAFDSIWLNFVFFELYDSQDGIVVYDGDTTAASELLRLTGPLSIAPDPIKSTTGKVLVTFTSDGTGEGAGFVAKWQGCK